MSRLRTVASSPPLRPKQLHPSAQHLLQILPWFLLSIGVAFILPYLAAAASIPAVSADPQAPLSPVARGIITLTSNLRDAPSTKSGVVGVAKERMPVEILTQTEHWYHIRTADGLEAWIYKPLVLIEPMSALPPQKSAISPLVVVEKHRETPAPEPISVPEVPLAEVAPSETAQEEQEQFPDSSELPAHQSTPTEPLPSPDEATSAPAEPATLSNPPTLAHEPRFEPFQNLGWFLVASVILVASLSVLLQWRASRQLRRARAEMDQIRDIIEDIYSELALSRPSTVQLAPSPPTPPPTAVVPLPVVEFSPLERALLDGLSSGEEVQEGELAKMLQEKGFPCVLIKAVISDIVHKTASDGRPWVDVKYARGRYAYALRPPTEARRQVARQGE
jgi:hypothetical protein